MDPCLLYKIPVSLPMWRKYASVPVLKGYSQVTSLTPIIKKLYATSDEGTKSVEIPTQEGQMDSDNLFGAVKEFEGSGSCTLITALKKKQKKAFCKVTHLLDPIRVLQGYYENVSKGERRSSDKLDNPMNQAFVDATANYLLGQLRDRNISPHFCQNYGSYQAVADIYRYNITEEFDSYRKYRSFWDKRRQGKFDLYFAIPGMEEEDLDKEIVEEFESWKKTPTSTLRSTAFSYKTPRSQFSETSHISLDGEEICDMQAGEQVELEVVGDLDLEEKGEENGNEDGEEDEEGSEEDSEDDSEEEPEINVFAQFSKMPVMLIFQEKMDGVLDDLLEDEEEQADQGSPEWETRWSAWTFQVIAALCAAQGVLGFTHNDLHTNNIVWSKTDLPWIFYKNRLGEVWRIPTFGKIFHIIDFGRSVFRVGSQWFVSDDYEQGGDAEGQYNFSEMKGYKDTRPDIYPNPSFDLCRYSVSVIEALFPENPIEKLNSPILSKEDDWIVYETKSPLWNLLWTWLVDENGKNVLRDEDGSERFPDFDLYIHIAAKVKSAKPQEQVSKEIFSQFKMPPNSVGDWETIYPLFC